MGKFFSSIWHEIKLGFKTVTFQFKQYICFYVAILAMQIMFGIIVMASANDIAQHRDTVNKDYSYHVVMTNLPESGVNQFKSGTIASKIENSEFYDVDVDGSFVYVTFNPDAAGDQAKPKSIDDLFNDFKGRNYAGYVESAVKTELKAQGYVKTDFTIKYETSPLYNLNSDITMMRVSCAIKLFVLALVAVAVIILLFNIRLNHFKFMYGIYMSFGADTKKLFSTSFWEMMVIGLLTLIPAGGIAYGIDFYLYATANAHVDGYIDRLPLALSPWLVAFALLFIIPIFLVAVYLPVKATASKPPLKLLLAEDNSNLVWSPKISTQLFGKKFPKAYESLGLWRYRKYAATLVASAVLFSSIFVWISFFRDIYDFNMNQDKAEFVVTARHETVDKKIWQLPADLASADVTAKYNDARTKVAADPLKALAFEQKYLRGDYALYFAGAAYNSELTAITQNGKNLLSDLEFMNKTFSSAFNTRLGSEDFIAYLGYLNRERFEFVENENEDGDIPPKLYRLEQVTIQENVYDELSDDDIDSLENIISNYGSVYKQCVSTARECQSYVAFHKKDVKWFTEFDNAVLDEEFVGRDSYRAGISVEYYATDEKHTIVSYLLDPENGYIIEGDPEAIYEPGNIIISENAANRQVLKIEPGDVVTVAVLKGELKKNTGQVVEQDKYLDRLMREGEEFEYREFKVCAVIKNMPTTENLPIYFHWDDYKAITGNDVVFNQFQVYINATSSSSDISTLHSELADWAQNKAEVDWNDAVAEARNDKTRQHLPIIQIIAIFALILSPLFWFFSQIMFFGKREKEFEILRGIGAIEKEIKSIFRKDGIIFALIGIGSTLVLSVLGSVIIHVINLNIVARFSVGARQLYKFHWEFYYLGYNGEPTFNIFWIALATAIIITGICGYMSSMIPYVIDKRKAKKRISHEFGE